MQLLSRYRCQQYINHAKTTEVYNNNIEMSDLSMACCNTEINTPETEKERRDRKNREKSARYRKKKSLIGYSDKELDNRRERGRLSQRKYVAKRKAQEQIQAAGTSKVGHNDGGGGGDDNVAPMAVDTTDTIDTNNSTGMGDVGMDIGGDGEGAGSGVGDVDEGNNEAINNEDAASDGLGDGLNAAVDGNDDDDIGAQHGNADEQDWCDNCMRKQMDDVDIGSPYFLTFHHISSSMVGKRCSPLKLVGKKTRNPVMYNLCTQCLKYTKGIQFMSESEKKTRNSWDVSWPSFIWNLLSGRDKSTNIPFHKTYEGKDLWKFIPISIRGYWNDIIKDIRYKSIRQTNEEGVEEPVLVDVLANHPNNIKAEPAGSFHGNHHTTRHP